MGDNFRKQYDLSLCEDISEKETERQRFRTMQITQHVDSESGYYSYS